MNTINTARIGANPPLADELKPSLAGCQGVMGEAAPPPVAPSLFLGDELLSPLGTCIPNRNFDFINEGAIPSYPAG